MRGFRVGAILAMVLPIVATFVTTGLALAGAVAMVFTFTASSLAPVVLLAIWWRGLTVTGAVSGMVTGGLVSLVALFAGHLIDDAGMSMAVLQYPALWIIPLVLVVTMLVSALDHSDRQGIPTRFCAPAPSGVDETQHHSVVLAPARSNISCPGFFCVTRSAVRHCPGRGLRQEPRRLWKTAAPDSVIHKNATRDPKIQI